MLETPAFGIAVLGDAMGAKCHHIHHSVLQNTMDAVIGGVAFCPHQKMSKLTFPFALFFRIETGAKYAIFEGVIRTDGGGTKCYHTPLCVL